MIETGERTEGDDDRAKSSDQPLGSDSLSNETDRHSFDHLLRTSIELDEVAKRNIEQLLALGSKRLAQDFKDMLELAARAVEQNANLLRILRHQLGTAKDIQTE